MLRHAVPCPQNSARNANIWGLDMGNRIQLLEDVAIPAGYGQEMWSRLLLPTEVKDAVEIAHMERERLAKEAEQAERDRREAEPTAPPKRRKTSREREIDELLALPIANPLSGEKNRVRLIDTEAAMKAIIIAMAGVMSDEALNRLSGLYGHLARTGDYRRVSTIPDGWRFRITQMMSDFPNFRGPINYLKSMTALSEVRDGAVHFEPMLLNGPSGIGKTYFCRSLAVMLGCHFVVHQMEQQQESSGLTGSSKFWSNTATGVIFETLIHGKVANPVIMIDEVDKASRGEFDPLAGLFGLLEKNTARDYVDQSLPYVRMDASKISWILTSNVMERIPAPIRNRVRTFEIEAPTPAEMRGIVVRIFKEICAEQLRHHHMEPLSDDVIDRLLDLQPRRIRPAVAEALGQAIYDDRRHLVPDDIKESLEQRRSIGFTAAGGRI